MECRSVTYLCDLIHLFPRGGVVLPSYTFSLPPSSKPTAFLELHIGGGCSKPKNLIRTCKSGNRGALFCVRQQIPARRTLVDVRLARWPNLFSLWF